MREPILRRALQLKITPARIVAVHEQAEFVAHHRALIEDVEERHRLPESTINDRVHIRARGIDERHEWKWRDLDISDEHAGHEDVILAIVRWRGAELLLLSLPDEEFLAAIENTVRSLTAKGPIIAALGGKVDTDAFKSGMDLMAYVDSVLRAHGAPYRYASINSGFEWVGDPRVQNAAIAPARATLGDARLAGASDDFEHAMRERRRGGRKELEDALTAAARSVESTLKVLLDAHGIARPTPETLTPLFNALKNAGDLPEYTRNLVCAAGAMRNAMGGHGPGEQPRQVPAELADAAIAAAATAIVYLAHRLP